MYPPRRLWPGAEHLLAALSGPRGSRRGADNSSLLFLLLQHRYRVFESQVLVRHLLEGRAQVVKVDDVQVECVDGAMGIHLHEEANPIQGGPRFAASRDPKVSGLPGVLQESDPGLQTGNVAEGERVEPLPMQILEDEHPVVLGHTRLSAPHRIRALPLLVALGPVTDYHELVSESSELRLLLGHVRLAEDTGGQARENIERGHACTEHLGLGVHDALACELVQQLLHTVLPQAHPGMGEIVASVQLLHFLVAELRPTAVGNTLGLNPPAAQSARTFPQRQLCGNRVGMLPAELLGAQIRNLPILLHDLFQRHLLVYLITLRLQYLLAHVELELGKPVRGLGVHGGQGQRMRLV
mmetsp:Transcript_68910/g.185732  ORF Transcript_68910/g.185732 Transcript_68910/m.185732 type:complete len:354 (+) Transcript_68910:2-1063(+)